MKFFKEFKEFAIKGNMVDMAIGIIMGTAFNNVVNVLVKKIFTPPLLILTDQANFSDQKYILREAAGGLQEIALGYGDMIEASIRAQRYILTDKDSSTSSALAFMRSWRADANEQRGRRMAHCKADWPGVRKIGFGSAICPCCLRRASHCSGLTGDISPYRRYLFFKP